MAIDRTMVANTALQGHAGHRSVRGHDERSATRQQRRRKAEPWARWDRIARARTSARWQALHARVIETRVSGGCGRAWAVRVPAARPVQGNGPACLQRHLYGSSTPDVHPMKPLLSNALMVFDASFAHQERIGYEVEAAPMPGPRDGRTRRQRADERRVQSDPRVQSHPSGW